ncbi:replication restart helicase PriA [Thermophagus xiamenensis]|uniref:Replication restart protein PriA n=1 Tax=Thermophagus xiamenensis TaxID=385682 RepID=A0A1I1UUT7_9BACT|nr:primosomal protein N' [Thermophagus xiamenensis]SFD74439.1 replication restart DNA helicase PriA [Thermophagus xiamenensis]
MTTDLYADIILPLPLPRLFTYHVPPEEEFRNLTPGMRVVVPFGKKKQYSGIVSSLHHNRPENYDTKPVITVLDGSPVVTSQQLDFWRWIAQYYLCTLGEVYKAALPSGLKLESETRVYYNPDYEQIDDLPPKAVKVLDFLAEKKSCSVADINDFLGQKNCFNLLQKLIDEEAVFVSERLKERYRPKTENFLRLSEAYCNEQALHKAFDALEKAPRQLELLMKLIQLSGGVGKVLERKGIARKLLLQEHPGQASALKELIKKGILEQFSDEVDRLDHSEGDLKSKHQLTDDQLKAFNEIEKAFNEHTVVLFHGVTSSGKTELYIHLIEKYLQKGEQVLYLLPEIALTTQITNRLKQHFGNKLGIYHSKFSNEERVEVYRDLLEEKNYQIILGVRSSIFLPFRNLGLIIIDEEHEHSFKQFDPAPRYHARDAAIMLAHMHNAKVLLGTATPSIESYYNAERGKYGLVKLNTRYEGIQLPRILVADLKEARRKKQMKSHFTPALFEQMEAALSNKQQIILFQNRRGFSPFLECTVCSWVPRCKYCDVSMTYHKKMNQLVCHYCGNTVTTPSTCQACGSPALVTQGFGTEKIEEEVKLLFPEAKVARMDLDTTRSKKSYQTIISQFESGAVDILIGTQMVTKGLDFDNVNVVGILNADNILNMPDFRAFERGFQLMAQVSGRAGRKNKRGTVVLQTSSPEHPIIKFVVENNYDQMYRTQMVERRAYLYPPYFRLIYLVLKHKQREVVDTAAEALANRLRAVLGSRVLGPQEPPVGRIQNQYLSRILIKFEKGLSAAHVKNIIQEAIEATLSNQRWKYVTVHADVDPL